MPDAYVGPNNQWVTPAQVPAQAAKLTVVSPPATAASAGEAGWCAFDANFFYICVAANTWLRVGIATW